MGKYSLSGKHRVSTRAVFGMPPSDAYRFRFSSSVCTVTMATDVSIPWDQVMDGDEDREATIRIPRAMLPQAAQKALGVSLHEAAEMLFQDYEGHPDCGPGRIGSSFDEEDAWKHLRKFPDYDSLSWGLPEYGLTIKEFKQWVAYYKELVHCAAPDRISDPAVLPVLPKRAPAPTIHNWDLIWEEAAMMAAEGKIPETQGAFFGALRQRIEAKNASVPDDETLRRKFRNLHAQLRERALTAPKGQKA